MAQTKKQRFREQKRAAKAPAPKPTVNKAPVKKASKSTGEPMADKKKIIIGAGALVAVAGAVGAIFLFANPLAATPEAKTGPPTATAAPPVVQREPDTAFYRTMLIRDYKLRVEQDLAEKVFQSCTSGESVTGSGRIRGEVTPVTITCTGTKLKVINDQTKSEILLDQPPEMPAAPPKP